MNRHRLTSTVTISLSVHLLAWGVVVWTGVLNPTIILSEKPEGKRQITLDFIKAPSKPKTPKAAQPELPAPIPPKPPKKKKLPNIFVQVDLKQASTKKPDDTDKYSDKNSLASNPGPDNKPKPKIDGSQREIPRAHDIPQSKKITSKPAPPSPVATNKTKERAESKTIPSTPTAAKPSDTSNETENIPQKLPNTPKPIREPKPKSDNSKKENAQPVNKKLPKKAQKKPAPRSTLKIASKPVKHVASNPKPTSTTPIITKPSDIKSAKPITLTAKPSTDNTIKPKGLSPLERSKRRLAKAHGSESQLLPGKVTKQDGGVPRKGIPSRDVQLTGYGDYDNKLITSIYNSWVRKNHEARMHEPYRVVVEFELLSSGRIENMRVSRANPILSKSIPEFICKRSIEEPAPFEQWDEKMKRQMGTRRPCRITFSFNIRD